MTDKEKIELLLPVVYKVLKVNRVLLKREYNKDISYNNESIGYKEQEEIIEVLDKIHGNSDWLEFIT